jgi:rhodanese-related sulfurtransferase
MPVKRVSPPEAKTLLDQGYKYVDVRSIPEFEAGHPAGAYNVPLMHFLPGRGMTPNGDFAAVYAKHFTKDDKVVVGCKTGGRSLRAAEMLQASGYAAVVDMQGGYEGEPSMRGWKENGLPIEAAAPGRTYADLQQK